MSGKPNLNVPVSRTHEELDHKNHEEEGSKNPEEGSENQVEEGSNIREEENPKSREEYSKNLEEKDSKNHEEEHSKKHKESPSKKKGKKDMKKKPKPEIDETLIQMRVRKLTESLRQGEIERAEWVSSQMTKLLEEEAEVDIEYLKRSFPDISRESLRDIYNFNCGDLEDAMDMLSMLEVFFFIFHDFVLASSSQSFVALCIRFFCLGCVYCMLDEQLITV